MVTSNGFALVLCVPNVRLQCIHRSKLWTRRAHWDDDADDECARWHVFPRIDSSADVGCNCTTDACPGSMCLRVHWTLGVRANTMHSASWILTRRNGKEKISASNWIWLSLAVDSVVSRLLLVKQNVSSWPCLLPVNWLNEAKKINLFFFSLSSSLQAKHPLTNHRRW